MVNYAIKEADKIDIHLPNGTGDDRTLCGLPLEGDFELQIEMAYETYKRATCEQCVQIVEHCKSILKVCYVSSARRALNPQQYNTR